MIIPPGIVASGSRFMPLTGVASARHTGTVAVSNPMSWNTEFRDQIGAYAAGQPTRFTLTQNAIIRMATNRFSISRIGQLYHLKNAANFNGMGHQRSRTSVNYTGTNIMSAPVEALTNDYFTSTQNEGTAEANTFSWHGIEVIPSALKGALVNRNSNQAYAAGTATTVEWNNEVYDYGGYHDNAVNPSRITIPVTGVYRLSCNVVVNATTYAWGWMRVNGAIVAGCPQVSHDLDCDLLNMCSAPMELNAGDYVDVVIQSNAAGNIGANHQTWFAIELVDPAIKRCLIYPTAAQNVTTGNPVINYGAETYDTAAMFNAGTNAQRIYIPSGCTEARITMNLGCAWNGGKVEPSAYHSAAGSGNVMATSHSHCVNALGLWVPVTPGDYVQSQFYAVNTRGLNTGVSSWLCVEAR